MKCVKCKKEIGNDELFCGYCGTNQAKFSKYLENVSKKIYKEQDKDYNNRVSMAENKLKELETAREKEIETITKNRWQNCGSAPFEYNMTEGKIKINDNLHIFSDVKGAEVVKEDSFKTITTSTGKTKKHVSLGKAVVGGALLGPAGAIAGGVMGKNTSSGKSVSNEVPMCNFIGVNVDINGFFIQIPVLNQNVEQSSPIYNERLEEAQNIVSKLQQLSTTKVPSSFLKPEEEQSVLDYDAKIDEAKNELQKTIDDKPNYEIPESYFK